MKRRALLGGLVAATALGAASDARAERTRRATIVVVGDPAVGKTWAAVSYTENRLADLSPSPALEDYSIAPQYRFPLDLSIMVLNGADDYERARPMAYATADAFIIAYALNRPRTLESVTEKWRPEILSHVPDARIMLAGMKSDLWTLSDPNVVSPRTLTEIAASFPASGHCSARTQAGLSDVFINTVNLIETFELAPMERVAPPRLPVRPPVRRPS